MSQTDLNYWTTRKMVEEMNPQPQEPQTHRCVGTESDDYDVLCSCGATFNAKREADRINAFADHKVQAVLSTPCVCCGHPNCGLHNNATKKTSEI